MDSWASSKKPLLTLEGTCFAILVRVQGEMMWNGTAPMSHVIYLRVSLIRIYFLVYTLRSWLLHVSFSMAGPCMLTL